jgi:hypothetical protein
MRLTWIRYETRTRLHVLHLRYDSSLHITTHCSECELETRPPVGTNILGVYHCVLYGDGSTSVDKDEGAAGENVNSPTG